MHTPEDEANGAEPDTTPRAGPRDARDDDGEPDGSDGVGPASDEGKRTSPRAGRRRGWIDRAATVLLILASLTALTAAMAGLGSRWGLWHFRTGFRLLGWAAYAGLIVALLSLPMAWLSRPGQKRRRGLLMALLALVVSAPAFVVPFVWRTRAGDVPPIHDISTDTNAPPHFQEIVPLRVDAANPVEYPGQEVAEQQRGAYPDIRPAVLDVPLGRAYERALAAARDMGWAIVDADAEEGRIEATDRTLWFGFTDDVVVRLTPSGDRTIVDVRSKSRVGRSDVGTNARRIRSYLERLTG